MKIFKAGSLIPLDVDTDAGITLEVSPVSDDFYVMLWIVAVLFVIILFNLAVMTTGVLGYAIHFMIKIKMAKKNPPVELQEEEEEMSEVVQCPGLEVLMT